MEPSNTNLSSLPNVGDTLAKRLEAASIHSIQELDSMGAEAAYLRLLAIEGDTCLTTLYALKGATRRIRWHALDKTERLALKEFFKKANQPLDL